MSDVDAYLPSLAAARAAGLDAEQQIGFLPLSTNLLEADPDAEDRLAVVIMEARVLRRDGVEKQLQLPEARIASLPATAPPAAWPTEQRAAYIVEAAPELVDCARCELHRGKTDCTTCGTRGYILIKSGDNHIRKTCIGCDGKGWLVCSACGGQGDARWVRMVEVDDRMHQLRYAYVPSMTDALDLAVGELFETLPEVLPAALQFELTPVRQESAYRGSTGRSERTFHGHRFGDAITRARAALQGMRGGGDVIHEEVKAYAWPLLWLSYRSLTRKGEVALLRDPKAETLRAITVD